MLNSNKTPRVVRITYRSLSETGSNLSFEMQPPFNVTSQPRPNWRAGDLVFSRWTISVFSDNALPDGVLGKVFAREGGLPMIHRSLIVNDAPHQNVYGTTPVIGYEGIFQITKAGATWDALTANGEYVNTSGYQIGVSREELNSFKHFKVVQDVTYLGTLES